MNYVLVFLAGTTLLNITLIAWNRYKLVTDLANYKSIFTATNVVFMLMATWLLPIICLIPAVLELWGKFGYVAMLVTCNLLLSQESQSFKIFLLFVRALVPCMLIAYFYLAIYRVTRASHHRMQENISNPSSYHLHIQKKDRKMIRSMYIIFLVFAVSYFPCAITGIIDWTYVLSKNFHMFCEISVYIGSALNPIIYGLMNHQFREAYLNLLLGSNWKHLDRKLPKKTSFQRISEKVTLLQSSNIKHIADLTDGNDCTSDPSIKQVLLLGRPLGVVPKVGEGQPSTCSSDFPVERVSL